MSNIGFKCGGGSGLKKGLGDGESSEGLDKIDMSLDDIIRLNRKEQQRRKPATGNRNTRVNGRFPGEGGSD